MSEPRHTKEELKYFRALPLDLKIRLTQDRIKAWVNMFGEDGVYVAFSGGKDSTVLLHLVRQIYPNVKAVFSNTGLEYPEIRQFAMSHDNVDVVYPEIKFTDVLTQYGYPLIGKEVAEAVYYARRIGGGREDNSRQTREIAWQKTSHQKRMELELLSTRRIRQEYRPVATLQNAPSSQELMAMGGRTEKRSGSEPNSMGKESKRRKDQFMGRFPIGKEKETRTQRIQSRGDDGDPF